MPIDDKKKVQALIQGLLVAVEKIEEADDIAQDIKTKYTTHNPSLTDSNLTAGEVTTINTFIASLSTLRNDAVITTL